MNNINLFTDVTNFNGNHKKVEKTENLESVYSQFDALSHSFINQPHFEDKFLVPFPQLITSIHEGKTNKIQTFRQTKISEKTEEEFSIIKQEINTFFACAKIFESNFKQLDLKRFSTQTLFFFLGSDSIFKNYKGVLALEIYSRLTQNPSNYFLGQGDLDLLSTYLPHVTKDQLLSFEHPTLLLDKAQKFPTEVYKIISKYSDENLKKWIEHSKEFPEIGFHLGMICPGNEKKTSPNSLSSRVVQICQDLKIVGMHTFFTGFREGYLLAKSQPS